MERYIIEGDFGKVFSYESVWFEFVVVVMGCCGCSFVKR